MLVYLSTKETFKADILSNRIEETILAGPSRIGTTEISGPKSD